MAIRKNYKRVVSVGFQGESPAYQYHFLDLDPNYRDKFGQPLLRITFDWEPNERAMIAYAGLKTLQIMQQMIPTRSDGPDHAPTSPDRSRAARARCPAHYDTVAYQSTHNTGGAIMGADPATRRW